LHGETKRSGAALGGYLLFFFITLEPRVESVSLKFTIGWVGTGGDSRLRALTQRETTGYEPARQETQQVTSITQL
jgi:hypothetical protein